MIPASRRILKWWLRVLLATGASKRPHAIGSSADLSCRTSPRRTGSARACSTRVTSRTTGESAIAAMATRLTGIRESSNMWYKLFYEDRTAQGRHRRGARGLLHGLRRRDDREHHTPAAGATSRGVAIGARVGRK